jgi:lysophospholipase L1-like esterase
MRRLLSIILPAGVLAAAILAVATPASAAGTYTHYVALGDSYSSGVGTGTYDSASGSCKRSPKAYPALWAAAHPGVSFSFVACSGATTASVTSGQLSAVTASTDLVSIGVGGNDVGFVSVLSTCVLASDSSCLSSIATAENKAQTTLPGALGTLFASIHSRAPGAHVVVLGYPRFYQLNGSCVLGMSETKRSAINNGADILDGVIAKAAADAGFAFGDVRGPFTNHGICSSSWWLNSLTWPVDDSYHPNATGQSQGYLPTFTSAL